MFPICFRLYLFIQFIMFCSSFLPQSHHPSRIDSALHMGPNKIGKRYRVSNPGNMPRKIKRTLRSIAKGTKNISSVYTDEINTFLRVKASNNIHDLIMKKAKRTFRHIGIPLDPEFGLRPTVKLPLVSEIMQSTVNTTIFSEAIKVSGIWPLLDAMNLTVFVPSDVALSALSENYFSASDDNRSQLISLLKSFILPKSFKLRKLLNQTESTLADLNGQQISVKSNRAGIVAFNGASVHKADLRCRNGYIHILIMDNLSFSVGDGLKKAMPKM